MAERRLVSVLWVVSVVFLALWIYSGVQPRTYPPESSKYFAPDLLLKSSTRAGLSYVNSGLASLASLAVLYALSRYVEQRPLLSGVFVGEFSPRRAALMGLCLGALAPILFSVVGLPFDIYSYNLNRSYGLSTMSLGAWFVDWGKGLGMSVIQFAAEGAFTAWAVARFSRTWPAVLSVSLAIATFFMTALYPIIIAPVFNEFHPLSEGVVLEDVKELADAAGMRVDKVLVMEASAKTTAANAYFTGIGSTKQVVLYDTLLESQSRENVRLVVAQELGHWKMGHIVKSVLLSAVAAAVLLFVFRAISPSAVQTFRSLELFLAALYVFSTLAGFALNPASAYISRQHEAAADAYALELTGDSPSFIESQVSFAKTNLGDIDPPAFIQWYAGTHPSTMDRIQSASKAE